MRRQSSLDNYFKSRSNIPMSTAKISDNNTKNKNKKRPSLSLNKSTTPTKTPKRKNEECNTATAAADVIDLCSDEEDIINPTKMETLLNLSQNSHESEQSDYSDTKTIIYELTPKTPQKTPPKPIPSCSRSPGSRDKFFSPTKKRIVIKRTPVKRNLAQQSFGSSQSNLIEDDIFTAACEGMDDKSIFLLTIINKCVKDESLKCLLDENSRNLLARCLQVMKPGVRLVCRLYWRQVNWYRYEQVTKISCDKNKVIDDPAMHVMLDSLVANGLLVQAPLEDNDDFGFDDLTKILKNDELKQICKDLKMKVPSKQDAIKALRSYGLQKGITQYISTVSPIPTNSTRVIKIMKAKAGPCYKLSDAARSTLYKLYLLMYLGMPYSTIREKKLELTLINDKICRETYPIDKEMAVDTATVVFKSQDEFEGYLKAHIVFENYLAETDSKEKSNIVFDVYQRYKQISDEEMTRYKSYPLWLRRYTPAHVYVKILESGVQDMKREKKCALAVDILSTLMEQVAFRQHKKAEWFAEKALILHKHLSMYNEAAEVLVEGLQSKLSDEAADVIRRRALKFAKIKRNKEISDKLRERCLFTSIGQKLEKDLNADHIYKQPMESYRGKIKFEIKHEGERLVVDAEEYCIMHYINKGTFTHGGHWEGRIVITIFFLLFWDIIYTKPRGITGIFLSHYQLHPLDLYCESFYTNRKILITDRLMQIGNSTEENLLEMMRNKWVERPEHELSHISRNIGWDNVSMVTTCLGPTRVAAICRRLATNFGYSHSGFPDLTMWNVRTKKIKFAEVKTDSDKPSTKQIQWMHYLQSYDINTGFCYVGVNTTRSKARAVQTQLEYDTDDDVEV